jgi:hypothetical protein
MPDVELLKGVLNFGSFGLIVWLFFHTYTRLIPGLQDRLDKMVDRFDAALTRQHAECNEMLERQHQKFDAMIAQQRETHERTSDRLAHLIARRNLEDLQKERP